MVLAIRAIFGLSRLLRLDRPCSDEPERFPPSFGGFRVPSGPGAGPGLPYLKRSTASAVGRGLCEFETRFREIEHVSPSTLTEPTEPRTRPWPGRAPKPVETATPSDNVSAGLGLLLPCFTVTIFVSALLLFVVQPMVAKMVLPRLGGTPAVWNTCLVFFQAVLLAGYAYAHLTTSWLGVRRQAVLHLGVLLVPLLVLPIVVERIGLPLAGSSPALWLLGCLLMTVGLPFFVVSTSGPLLQKWFAGTNHPSAKDPFFLYAASNAGSLIALLGYPLLLERWLPVAGQSRLWSYGYVLLIALVGACAVLLWRRRHGATGPGAEPSADDDIGLTQPLAAPTLQRRMWWLFAAFVPSSLMLGVTTHITSNLAPVPLLWVLPLSIYLLTFVLVFARKQLIPAALTAKLLPFMVLPLAIITIIELPKMGWVAILAHLATFFVAAMVCHGQLARSRPHVRHLTEYYLWISIGGVLGGIFNALISPVVFSSIAEYPIALVLACFLLPRTRSVKPEAQARRNDLAAPLAVAVVTIAAMAAVWLGGWGDSLGMRLLLFGPLGLVCFSFKDRPVRFTLGLAVFVATLPYYCAMHRGQDLYESRNFFGVKRVTIDPDKRFRTLVHGTTTHGKQLIDPARRNEPVAYYHRSGPLGDIFATFSGDAAKAHVGVIGLGAGSLASYIGPQQSITFYEIDPEIERIARNPEYFTFLTDCPGDVDVVVGDGRLTLAQGPDRHYGLFVLDAFSSDAIPTHLLTREAIQLYLSKLEEDGVLAFHISNRYLNLEPLIAGLVADAGLVGLTRTDTNVTAAEKADGKIRSIYAVLARKREHLAGLVDRPGWLPLSDPSDVTVWTDQYTSILDFFSWR